MPREKRAHSQSEQNSDVDQNFDLDNGKSVSRRREQGTPPYTPVIGAAGSEQGFSDTEAAALLASMRSTPSPSSGPTTPPTGFTAVPPAASKRVPPSPKKDAAKARELAEQNTVLAEANARLLAEQQRMSYNYGILHSAYSRLWQHNSVNTAALAKYASEKQALITEIGTLRQAISNHDSRVSLLTQQIEGLQKENTRLTSEVSKASALIPSLQQKYTQQHNQLAAQAREIIAAKEAEITKLSGQISSLNDRVDTLMHRAVDYDRRMDEMRRVYRVLSDLDLKPKAPDEALASWERLMRHHPSYLAKTIHAQQGHITSLDREIASLKNPKVPTESASPHVDEHYRSALEELHHQVLGHAEENAALKARIYHLETEKAEGEARNSRLKSTISDLFKERSERRLTDAGHLGISRNK